MRFSASASEPFVARRHKKYPGFPQVLKYLVFGLRKWAQSKGDASFQNIVELALDLIRGGVGHATNNELGYVGLVGRPPIDDAQDGVRG